MKVIDFISARNWTKTDLAKRLGVSKALIGKWDEIPEKYLKELEEDLPEGIAERHWWVREDKLHWGQMGTRGLRVDVYGHGSEYDYDYSMAMINHIRSLLDLHKEVQAVFEWVNPTAFPRAFIEDVKKDCVCPNTVDMRKQEGGRPIPIRVFPFGERG